MPLLRLSVKAPVAANRLTVTLMSSLRRVFRNCSGAAAVEFAIIAPIFLMLMCGIIENGLILLTQSTLDNATRDAARTLMLGSASQATFLQVLNSETSGLVPTGNLNYNVQSGTTFAGLNGSVTTDKNGNMVNAFSSGGSHQAILVRVSYNRPFILPSLASLIGLKSELLMSTVALKSEPY